MFYVFLLAFPNIPLIQFLKITVSKKQNKTKKRGIIVQHVYGLLFGKNEFLTYEKTVQQKYYQLA